MLHEVLPVVSGEVYQVPQQERLHHGEPSIVLCRVIIIGQKITIIKLHLISIKYIHLFIFLLTRVVFLSDCRLWEKLLRLSQKRFQAADEKRIKVCAKLPLPTLR